MDLANQEYRPMLLTVLGKLVALNTQVENRYVYEWDALDPTNHRNVRSVVLEDGILGELESMGIIATKHIPHPLSTKYIPSEFSALIDPSRSILVVDPQHPNVVEVAWTLHVEKIDLPPLEGLLEDIGLAIVGDSITPISSQGTDLPAVQKRLGGSFTLHTDHSIRYKLRPIVLEPQQKNAALLIMTSSMPVTSAALGGRLGTASPAKTVSEVRIAFRTATGIDKNFFPRRDGGYVFEPVK